MKIVVVLLVLALTLVVDAAEEKKDIGGEAAAVVEKTAEAKKAEEDACNTTCQDKEPASNSVCKEACGVNHRFKMVWLETAKCSVKCSEVHGFDSPATKSCEAGCKKEYEAKAAEVTASCNAVCSKVDKDPLRFEACKKMCTPALIMKATEEAMMQRAKP